jgi:predicted secreted protein
MLRQIMTGLAVLALAACGSSPSGRAAEGQEVAAIQHREASEERAAPEFTMPTADEAAAAAAAAQAKAEEGVIYAGAGLNGGSLTLVMGETLRIELQSVPTAGYVWIIAEKPDFLELLREGGRPTDPAHQSLPGFTGGNHYLSFDFLPAAAGTGVIRLTEGRPWETDEPPMDEFTLTVTVP